MKKIFLIYLLISNSVIHAQLLNLNELISLNQMNIDDFDSYIVKKGYEFDGRETKEDREKYDFDEYYYSYQRNNVNNHSTHFISKGFFNFTKKRKVSYQTTNKNEYIQFKDKLKELGFKFVNTQIVNGFTFFDYIKDNTEISIALIKAKNSLNEQINAYEISVTTPNNNDK